MSALVAVAVAVVAFTVVASSSCWWQYCRTRGSCITCAPLAFLVFAIARRAAKKAKVKGKKPAAPKKDTSTAGIAGLKPTVGTQFREQLHNLMDMIR